MEAQETSATRPNERLRLARLRLGLKQKEVAEKMKLHPGSYNVLETGKVEIHGRHLDSLKNHYGISPEWIKNGKGEMFVGKDGSYTAFKQRIAELEDEVARYKKIVDVLTKIDGRG